MLPLKCHSGESRNPDFIDMTGLPPEFIPHLLRDGSDEFGIIRGSLNATSIETNHRLLNPL